MRQKYTEVYLLTYITQIDLVVKLNNLLYLRCKIKRFG